MLQHGIALAKDRRKAGHGGRRAVFGFEQVRAQINMGRVERTAQMHVAFVTRGQEENAAFGNMSGN